MNLNNTDFHRHSYQHGPLLQLMMQHLRVEDVRNLHELDDQQFRQLRSFLKGVVVSFTVAPNMRPRPISGLVDEAGLQVFDKENERWSVEVCGISSFMNRGDRL